MIRRRVDFVINDDKFKDADGNVFQKIGSLYKEGTDYKKIKRTEALIIEHAKSKTGIVNYGNLSKKKPIVQIL